MLLSDCLVTPPSPQLLIGNTPVETLIANSRRFLVNRLFHLWGEFCKSLVIASAVGGYVTYYGQTIARAPNISNKSDIAKVIKRKSLDGPGLRWEDPAWTHHRIDELRLSNRNQLKLGIASAPYNDLRVVRHFIVHSNAHTRRDFEGLANKYSLFGAEPEDLLLRRIQGGGTILEVWIREFQIAARAAIK